MVAQVVTLGVLRAYQSETARDGDGAVSGGSIFKGQVMDKLFTKVGSGFASVVGSFARNLVVALYADGKCGGNNSSSIGDHMSETNDVPRWVNVVSGEKLRDLIGNCIQLL
ncbi:hypothetical protein ACFX11_040496 [Malus domestica]